MAADSKNILEWVKDFKEFKFSDPDVSVQIEAGWYDWFCNDSALASKTKKLGKKLIQILNSPKINPRKQYVFFKNNCPCMGNLYDDFRICDLESGDVIFTIVPSSGHTVNKGRSEVWGKANDFKEPLITGTWKDVLKYFND